MFLVCEHSVEECDYLRIAIGGNGFRIGIEWIGRVVNASERVIVHVVEALVVPPNPSVEYCNNRSSSV